MIITVVISDCCCYTLLFTVNTAAVLDRENQVQALGMGVFLMGAQLGHLEWAPVPGTLRYG